MSEEVKRTAEAHGTVSEEKALEEAKDAEKVSEEMMEREEEKKVEAEEKEVEEKVKKFEEKEIEQKEKRKEKRIFEKEEVWDPKTKLGRDVKEGKIKNIDEILDKDKKILEPEIVDNLIEVKADLSAIGQAKGKFGGGKRRAWRQTQRKTKEGNVPTFSAMAIIGDERGHVGFGVGKAKETLPARDKAQRKAKINVMKVRRTCAAFDCACSEPHTVPFKVTGKEGSVRVILMPAPQGTGLVAGDEIKKVLKMAGIKDVYSKTFGRTRTTFNTIKATIDALSKTTARGG